MESILSSLRTAVIVVDDNLHVLSWNQQAQEFWGLRLEEVKGPPFGNLDFGLPVSDVLGMVRRCLSDGGDAHEKLFTARNRRGREFTCPVGCTPLVNNGAASSRVGVILMMEERSGHT